MEKTDRIKIALMIATAIVVYFLMKRKNENSVTQSNQPNEFINNPNFQSYLPSTQFQPLNPENTNININVGNQGLSYLNDNYIPLFGFVGIAQGTLLQ